MVNHDFKKIFLFLAVINLFSASLTFAATDATNPGNTPTTKQIMIQCPVEMIDNTRVTSSPQTINFSADRSSIQTIEWGVGGAYFAYFAGGGGPNFICNDNNPGYPYLAGFRENWGGGGAFVGPIGFFYLQIQWTSWCSTTPRPRMSLTYGSTGSKNTWVQGTYCP